MATSPLKLTDLLKLQPYPAGGFTIANSTPATMLKPSPISIPAAPLAKPVMGNDLSRYLTPGFSATPAPAAPAPMRTAPAPVPTPPPAAQVPPQYLNPDGTFKHPDQIASEIGSTLKTSAQGGDVGKLALDQFGNEPTTTDAIAAARRVDNTRNDIASGATDPYKVASESGIAYTPAELSAIERAYAGVYDPALDTALAKVQQKQEEDKMKLQADLQAKNDANQPYTLGKDQVRFDGQGNPIAVGISSDTGVGSGAYVKGQNPVVDSYVQGFKNGVYKASDIPDQYKDLVAQGIAAGTGPGATMSKAANDALGIVHELQGLSDLGKLSGTGFVGGVEHPSSLFPGTEVQNAQNLAKQLQGTLSLANRTQLKGSGAISDFEFRVLGEAASALGINDSGRTNLSPDQFKNQLHKLEVRLQVGQVSLPDDEVQYLSDQGYTPEQIRAYDQGSSFNDVGNTTASTGNRPQRNNNPGNVKAGGLADALAVGKDEQGHLIFPDAATGFKALTADVTAKINGGSSHLPANPTIAELGKVYAEDPNWPKKVAKLIGVPVDTHTQAIPIANLVKAIATQEGFYA